MVSWYADGKWRMEDWRDGTLESVQVFDGTWSHHYHPRENRVYLRASQQPFGTAFRGFTVDTLFGEAGDHEVTREEVEGTEGQPLNRFTITDRELGERTIADADLDTDLPVRIELWHRAGIRWEKAGGSDVMEYNVAVDPKLFVLEYPPDAEVIDEEEVRAEWQQRHDTGLLRVDVEGREAVLRDFQVTTGGDVFAIYTGGGTMYGMGSAGASLTDSLGTVYATDQRGHGYFQARSEPCAWFVPVVPPTRPPAWYKLTVTTGRHGSFGFQVTKPVRTPSEDPAFPNFRVSRGGASFLYPHGATGEAARAEIRAVYWKEAGDPRKAIQWYEQMIARMDREYGRYGGQSATWLEIGSVYEQLGQKQQAREAYQRGLDCHDRSPNRDNPDEREYAEKLHVGLKRVR